MSSDEAKKSSCVAINHPSMVPSWGCCECKTLNGNNRQECKFCNHARCDSPDVMMVPAETDTGMVIVPVQMNEEALDKNTLN